MDVVWPNRFKLNRFETGLSASVNGAIKDSHTTTVTKLFATTAVHCKKGFVILTIALLTRITTVDTVLWDDTRIVLCDSQLWVIQCIWSSYRNN